MHGRRSLSMRNGLSLAPGNIVLTSSRASRGSKSACILAWMVLGSLVRRLCMGVVVGCGSLGGWLAKPFARKGVTPPTPHVRCCSSCFDWALLLPTKHTSPGRPIPPVSSIDASIDRSMARGWVVDACAPQKTT